MVKFSFLLSVFNGEDWLCRCIESVLSQDYPSFEFIIVNDGSDDSSHEIISHYASLDNRIIYLSRSNHGLPKSLNYGLNYCSGDWIVRIDADDVCEPTRLSCACAYLNSNSHRDFSLFGSWSITHSSFYKTSILNKYPDSNLLLFLNCLLGGRFFSHSSSFINSSRLKVYGYNDFFLRSQDRELWLKLFLLGDVGCIPEPLVHVYNHSSQISNSDNGRLQVTYFFLAVINFLLTFVLKRNYVFNNRKNFNVVNKILSSFFYFEFRKFFLRNYSMRYLRLLARSFYLFLNLFFIIILLLIIYPLCLVS